MRASSFLCNLLTLPLRVSKSLIVGTRSSWFEVVDSPRCSGSWARSLCFSPGHRGHIPSAPPLALATRRRGIRRSGITAARPAIHCPAPRSRLAVLAHADAIQIVAGEACPGSSADRPTSRASGKPSSTAAGAAAVAARLGDLGSDDPEASEHRYLHHVQDEGEGSSGGKRAGHDGGRQGGHCKTADCQYGGDQNIGDR